jgi:hypothetical protein
MVCDAVEYGITFRRNLLYGRSKSWVPSKRRLPVYQTTKNHIPEDGNHNADRNNEGLPNMYSSPMLLQWSNYGRWNRPSFGTKGRDNKCIKILVCMEGKRGWGVLTNIISDYDYATCPASPLSLFWSLCQCPMKTANYDELPHFVIFYTCLLLILT